MSFILITVMFDSVVILWGEIRCKSQLGVKGIKGAKPVVTASRRCLRYLLIGQGSNQNDNFSGKTQQKVFSDGGFSEDPGPGARGPGSPPLSPFRYVGVLTTFLKPKILPTTWSHSATQLEVLKISSSWYIS